MMHIALTTAPLLIALFYIFSMKWRNILYPGLVLHLLVNVYLWNTTGYPPFIGGYGSVLFFSFLLAGKSSFMKNRKFCGALLSLAILFLFSSFFMTFEVKKISAVLSSIWLGIHVPLYFLGYLSLSTAFAASFVNGNESEERREMAFALLFLTAGFVTGACWAEVAWGRFFGFDAKEVWALSTWMFVFSYFFFDQKKHQRVAVYVSFFSMVMTYIVVSHLLPSLHGYM